MEISLFHYHCVWVREILLQWKVDRLTNRLWDLQYVRQKFLPEGSRAHTSNVLQELDLRLRIDKIHLEITQVQQKLGIV